MKLVHDTPDLIVIDIELPLGEINANLQISSFLEHNRYDVSQMSRKKFEPDIVALQEIATHTGVTISGTDEISDLAIWIIEAETTPNNLLRDTYRRTAYQLLRLRDENVRHPVHLILAVYEDVQVPEDTKPFDQVWRFKREKETEQEGI